MNQTCNLCNKIEENQGEMIQYTCNHAISFSCFPYALLQNFKHEQFKNLFNDNLDQLFTCSICGKGKASLISQDLKKLMSKIPFNSTKKKVNEVCVYCNVKKNDFLCLQCEISSCSTCFESKHQGHKFIDQNQIIFSCNDAKNYFKETNLVLEKLISGVKDIGMKYLDGINSQIDEIIKKLRNIKGKIEETMTKQQDTVINLVELLKKCNEMILNDISLDSNEIDSNKKFKINKNTIVPSFSLKDFELNYSPHNELDKLKQSLNNVEFFTKDVILECKSKMTEIEYFSSNPLKFQSSVILNDISWSTGSFIKSKKLINFKNGNENLIAWTAGGQIQVYNFTKNKREIVLENEKNNKFEFIDVLQPDFIYSGDGGGILNIWSLQDYQKSFTINAGQPILSGVVFKDLYGELNNDLVIVLSFENKNSPISFFNKNGGLIKKLEVLEKRKCDTIVYFSNKNAKKTYLLFAIAKNSIKLYDLKTEKFLMTFKCNSHINSINFIKLKDSDFYENFIYSNKVGELTLANLKDGKILLERKLENSYRIWDFCVWNEEIICIAANDNSIKLAKTEDFKVIKSIKTTDSPINLVKIKEKNQEFLVCVQDDKKIVVFNEKEL